MARIPRSMPKPIVLPERPRRPQPTAEPEFVLKGGWIFNPPKDCIHKKIDSDRQYSVESVRCAFHCAHKLDCKGHDWLMKGSKNRKKYMEE